MITIFGSVFFAGQLLAANDNNGFPSGDHYNLNIIGKKDGFSGCTLEPDPVTLLYGNVVFVPEWGEGDIWLQSGKVGGKASAITTLQVLDNCVSAFDTTKAVVQIPPNQNGYRVYARALAKPTDDPYMTITSSLLMVEDEVGTPLLFLGTVTSNGFVSATGVTFTRSKGQSKAVPISEMFEWTGYVCYVTSFDPDGEGTFYSLTPMCGIDTSNPIDGIVDQIALPVDHACGEGTLMDLYCHHYDSPTWVFNIADFVTYLWSTDNNGLKLLQVRFYPN
jgi:hypothetical protein